MRTMFLTALVLAVMTACATSPDATSPAGSVHAGGPTAPDTTTGINPEQAARLAPLAPALLVATTDGTGRVHLSWPGTGEDVAYYQLLRRTPGTPAATPWEPIGRTGPDVRTYIDPDPRPARPVYGVQAVNGYGTASAITEAGA